MSMLLSRFLLTLLFIITVVTPFSVKASAELKVTPILIDRDLQPRDIITETITVSNPNSHKVNAYATVNEINLDSGGEIQEFIPPSMSDRSSSVTSWISIQRSRIEIAPNSEVEVPLTIQVNPFAKPGDYHVFIGIYHASKRFQAEEAALKGEANGLILSISIAENRQSLLRLGSYIVNRFVATDKNREISYTVTNPGEKIITPSGEIIFYDSRGREVESVALNEERRAISPGETVDFTEIIPLEDKIGKYKAFFNMEYGETQMASLQDTAFFYMVPIRLLIIIFVILLVLTVILAILLRRTMKYSDDDEDSGDEVSVFVREGYFREEKEHDIKMSK